MWLGLWMLGALGGAVAAVMRDECPPRSCTSSTSYRARPVCGSDGKTYQSQCALERVRCDKNLKLTVARRGRCKEARPCHAGLAYAQSHSAEDFRPQCKPDGTYAPVQCHMQDFGYCWCVTPLGQPLPNTAVQRNASGKPRCVETGKSNTRRRSPNARSRKSNKRNCKRVDKAIFNNNLLRIFHSEMARETSVGGGGGDVDRLVLEWKFRKMDQDQSGSLDKTEYRDLRRIVKKVVKPKRCAKSFARACDMDRDQHISRQEWADCLSKDGLDDVRGGEDSANDDQDEDDDEDGDDDLLSFGSVRSPPHGVLQGSATLTSSAQNYNDDSGERRDEDATDCLSDRQAVLNEQRADKLYVPECTPDGRYQKVQCYKSAGYCWCVHEDTGKNIPGTSVKNQTPKCDQMPTPRPMKGCPEPKKSKFLKELMAFLLMKMAKETNGTNITGSIGSSWKASKEEQVATWNFVVLDKNKNKVLERFEWKAFREMVANVKSLRRCGRKLPRYCDINQDRKISMTEWLDCLNAQRSITEQALTTVSPGSARTGRNPLSLLMED